MILVGDFQKEDLDVAVEFVQPYDDNGWNQGTITVSAQLAAASSVWVSIERPRSNVKMFVDDVSMTRITQNCNTLVSNGDFGQGTSIFWSRSEPSPSWDFCPEKAITLCNYPFAKVQQMPFNNTLPRVAWQKATCIWPKPRFEY
jgi:hypothetical protein